MSEETKVFMKKFKEVVSTLGEALTNSDFEHGYELAMELNRMIKDDETYAILSDKDKLFIIEVKEVLRKYWFINGEFRKFRGALIAKGKDFSSKL